MAQELRSGDHADVRFVLAAGSTDTASIDGISAAGASPDVMAHTPSADAEILEYGRPVRAPVVPVSPSGCPTPAVVTRAVRERLDFPATVVDAGLAADTAAPTVNVGASPGDDVRAADPVPTAPTAFEAARELGRSLPEDLFVAETIPGGTTTALGVFAALGEGDAVSSSLPANPLSRKRDVVAGGLEASDLSRGDAAGDPVEAVRRMGDPVLATVAGLAVGALDDGRDVTLAGGSQMLAAAALVRHAGADGPLGIATTSFVAADESVDVRAQAAALDLDLTVTDPRFDRTDHVAMQRYEAGEAKEGVGMGGALALADRADLSMTAVRAQVVDVYDRLLGEE